MKAQAIALKKGCSIYAGKGVILTVSQKRLPPFVEGVVYIVVDELAYPLVMREEEQVEVVDE